MSIVVFYIDHTGLPSMELFKDGELTAAIHMCAHLRKLKARHVCMSSELDGQVGGNGVTSVEDGKLPDGSDYTWMKRRTQ